MSEVADGPETSVNARPAALAIRLVLCAGFADAQVVVGHQRERPAPLPRAAVEHDRAGLRDRERGSGQGAVETVELMRRQAGVDDQLHALGPPRGR